MLNITAIAVPQTIERIRSRIVAEPVHACQPDLLAVLVEYFVAIYNNASNPELNDMNSLQIFNNPEFGEIRTIQKDGEPWFVLKDVCRKGKSAK